MAIEIFQDKIKIGGFYLQKNDDIGGLEYTGPLTVAAMHIPKYNNLQGLSGALLIGGLEAGGPTRNGVRLDFSTDGLQGRYNLLTTGRYGAAGQASFESAYVSGGKAPSYLSTIEKVPFAGGYGSGGIVGNLTVGRSDTTGHSSDSHGYTAGGLWAPPIPVPYYSVIDRFPFASDSVTVIDWGDLYQGSWRATGTTTVGYGYHAGGSPGAATVLTKFPFASTTGASLVGSIYSSIEYGAGCQSETHGYITGGTNPTYIQKFSFSVDDITTSDISLLYFRSGKSQHAGASSKTHGYGVLSTANEKFSFSAGNFLIAYIPEISASNRRSSHMY